MRLQCTNCASGIADGHDPRFISVMSDITISEPVDGHPEEYQTSYVYKQLLGPISFCSVRCLAEKAAKLVAESIR